MTTDDGTDGPWTTLSSDLHYENPWIRVVEHQVVTPSGTRGLYGTVHFRKAGAGVVPIDANGRTWLVGQHRYPLKRFSWEIPVGGVDADETPCRAAARELSEEAGLRADHWLALFSCDFSTGITDEHGYAFLAWGLHECADHREETEAITVRRLPFADALAMIDAGEIRDLLSIASLQRVRLLALEQRLPAALRQALARC